MTHFLFKNTGKFAIAAAVAGILTACGGGSDSVPSATLEVVPALGAVYNADVTVLNSTGGVLGSGSTGSTGKAAVKLFGSTSGPIVVKLSLTTASSYFNEKTGQNVNVPAAVSLLSVAPSLPSSLGVTPLTNTAAKMAGLNAATVGSAAFTVTAAQATEGAARTLLALGLPANFPLLSAPVPATLAAPAPTDLYGNLLAKLAARSSVSPLDQAKDLSDAATTGGIATGGASLFNTASALLVTIAPAGVTLVTPKQNPTTSELASATTTISNTFVPAGSTGASGSTGGSGSGGGSL